MVTFCTLVNGAELRGRSSDSDLHYLATMPVDRFVEVLSLELAASGDLRDGERCEVALPQVLSDRPDGRAATEDAPQLPMREEFNVDTQAAPVPPSLTLLRSQPHPGIRQALQLAPRTEVRLRMHRTRRGRCRCPTGDLSVISQSGRELMLRECQRVESTQWR